MFRLTAYNNRVKIKAKLIWSIGLLFALIIVLGGVSAGYIHLLKADTENILVANYNTLTYANNMLVGLDNNNPATVETNLQKQEANITESGEKQSTQVLRSIFMKYKRLQEEPALKILLRRQIYKIMEVNMQAIERKNNKAKATADNAIFWIVSAGSLCFIIALFLFVKLPAYIANPVQKLSELDFAKTNFIATVSHEFKTPIAAIKMSLQLLNNDKVGTLNEEQKGLLNSINDDTNRLLRITAELLNMTQVESGNIQLAIMPGEATTILHYALKAVKTQAEQKQITLSVTTAERLPLIMADSEKTAWVLTNLLSNAIRYSPQQASVVVQVKANATQAKVDFIIQDNGQGIAPEYKDKIFDRYFRVPGTQTEGTGLGLAISKEFVEAQGGSIQVQSELGKGSTFTVSLASLV